MHFETNRIIIERPLLVTSRGDPLRHSRLRQRLKLSSLEQFSILVFAPTFFFKFGAIFHFFGATAAAGISSSIKFVFEPNHSGYLYSVLHSVLSPRSFPGMTFSDGFCL